MKYIDEKTPQARVFYAMYLLQKNQLSTASNIYVRIFLFLNYFSSSINYLFQREAVFPQIADVIIESLEVDVVESYFIAKNFYKYSEEIVSELPKLKQLTFQYLEKEDAELFG